MDTLNGKMSHRDLPLRVLNSLLVTLVIVSTVTATLLPLTIHFTLTTTLLIIDLLTIRLLNLHWHLLHDAVHRTLFETAWVNEWVGQILSVLFFSSFTALRFGHLLHHRINRFEDTSEVYFDDKPPRLAYYIEILGGFYLVAEFLAPLLSLIPQSIAAKVVKYFQQQLTHKPETLAALRRLVESARYRQLRWEALAQLAFFSLAVGLYWHHLGLFFAYFFLRALLVSYYNNMPHYGNSVKVDRNAADNAYLPTGLARLFLNFNYHRTHHCHPNIPWYGLPAQFAKDKDNYQANFLRSYFAQLKGPIASQQLPLT